MDKEKLARKMVEDEYGKDLGGCLKGTVVAALILLAIGVAVILLSL